MSTENREWLYNHVCQTSNVYWWGSLKGLSLDQYFFLIFVDDISERLLSLTRSFANDSSLFCSAASIQDIESIINHDLRILISRANQWLIKLNTSKTEAILFTLRHFEKNPNLIFNGTQIQFVDDHKH